MPDYISVMRILIALAVLATPATAWEFTASPVCTVTHETPDGDLTLTYDPRQPEPYAIAVTSAVPWPNAPVFGMRFDGPRALTITTDRQTLDGQTLTVRDQGFGNVLNGLEFNETATALLGDTALSFPLDDAAPEIQRFRACLVTPIA